MIIIYTKKAKIGFTFWIKNVYFPVSDVSVFGYFTSELTRGYLLERDKAKFTERRQRVYTFMKTPRELEKVKRLLHIFMY